MKRSKPSFWQEEIKQFSLSPGPTSTICFVRKEIQLFERCLAVPIKIPLYSSIARQEGVPHPTPTPASDAASGYGRAPATRESPCRYDRGRDEGSGGRRCHCLGHNSEVSAAHCTAARLHQNTEKYDFDYIVSKLRIIFLRIFHVIFLSSIRGLEIKR